MPIAKPVNVKSVVKSFVVVRWNRRTLKLRHSCTLWHGILFNMAIYMQVYGLVFYVPNLIFSHILASRNMSNSCRQNKVATN